jgi:quercetin dioxygenase-like cupin family protein
LRQHKCEATLIGQTGSSQPGLRGNWFRRHLFGILHGEYATPKAILIWEEAMPTLVGFGTFAALPEERISEKISRRVLSGDHGMIVWWSMGAGVHVEPHSHANEQIVWMLKGKMEFRLGNEQRVCGRGDVLVIPGGIEHEAWFREDTEVIDFFAPPRDDFLLGGKPAYMSEG